MRVLVTRPAEDAQEIAEALAAQGHYALIAPLLKTHFHDAPAPALDGVQAILATSANGVRALARVTPRRDIPVFAVGPQTAKTALSLGFASVRNADGDALALGRAAIGWAERDQGALLHAKGEAKGETEGALARFLVDNGFVVREAALYYVEAERTLPFAAAQALASGQLDAALFFSPRSASVFRELVSAANLADRLSLITAICISENTAKALIPLAFAEIRIALAPNQASLLLALGEAR